VAIVNGSGISLADYERELIQIRKQARQQGHGLNETQLSVLRNAVLENLIGRELLFQESLKAGITAPPGDVDSRLAYLETGFPETDAFIGVLSHVGLTPMALERQIRRSMILQRFIDQRIKPRVAIADREVRSFYDRNQQQFVKPESIRASHILIKSVPGASEAERRDALSRIEAIRQRLISGEDFAQLARLYSEGLSGSSGGDLGYFGCGQMTEAFDETAFSLLPGEISDVVETDYGFHLIQITGKLDESTLSFEEMEDAIRQELKRRRIQKDVVLYIEKLEGTADIKRYLR